MHFIATLRASEATYRQTKKNARAKRQGAQLLLEFLLDVPRLGRHDVVVRLRRAGATRTAGAQRLSALAACSNKSYAHMGCFSSCLGSPGTCQPRSLVAREEASERADLSAAGRWCHSGRPRCTKAMGYACSAGLPYCTPRATCACGTRCCRAHREAVLRGQEAAYAGARVWDRSGFVSALRAHQASHTHARARTHTHTPSGRMHRRARTRAFLGMLDEVLRVYNKDHGRSTRSVFIQAMLRARVARDVHQRHRALRLRICTRSDGHSTHSFTECAPHMSTQRPAAACVQVCHCAGLQGQVTCPSENGSTLSRRGIQTFAVSLAVSLRVK